MYETNQVQNLLIVNINVKKKPHVRFIGTLHCLGRMEVYYCLFSFLSFGAEETCHDSAPLIEDN